MTTSATLATLLTAASAVVLLGPSPGAAGLRRLDHSDHDRTGSLRPAQLDPARLPGWLPRALAVGAGAAALAGAGATAVMLAVATVTVAVPRRRALATADELSRAAEAAVPRAAGLLATCLRAGLPLREAAGLVAAHLDPDAGRRLRRAVRTAAVGSDVAPLSPDGGAGWSRLHRAVRRSADTGAPLADVLDALAVDQAERLRWTAEEAVRRVGVRAVGPLGACFLPAFVLVGVVPVVAGIAASVLGDLP